MPLRARIFWYCCATELNLLPAGPLAMLSVLGGAGRTKCRAANMAIALRIAAGPSVCARSRQDIVENLSGAREDGGLRSDSPLAAAASSPIPLSFPVGITEVSS